MKCDLQLDAEPEWPPKPKRNAGNERRAYLDTMRKAQIDYLDALLKATKAEAAKVAEARSAEPHTVSHLLWRRVPRQNLLDVLEKKLQATGRVAIVGMSGTGKSFLARDYFNRFDSERRKFFSAPKPSDDMNKRRFEDANIGRQWIDLGFDILSWIGRKIPAPSEDRKLRAALIRLLHVDATKAEDLQNERRYADFFEKFLEEFYLRTDRSIADTASAIRSIIQAAPTLSSTKSLLILIDDLWNPDHPKIKELLDAITQSGDSRPIRLLITSQRRYAAFYGNAPLRDGAIDHNKFQSHTLELDKDDHDREEFAWWIVAAYAVKDCEDLTPSEGLERIRDFARKVLRIDQRLEKSIAAPAARDYAYDLGPIESVIRKLNYHPLALAAFASAWRMAGLEKHFWSKMGNALDSRPQLEISFLDLEGNSELPEEFNPDHRIVTRALLLAADELSPLEKQLYYDLAIAPRSNEHLALQVFRYYWWRSGAFTARNCEEIFGRDAFKEREPIRDIFAQRMLVQSTEKNTFVLHDMHYMSIRSALDDVGESVFAERHLDFLKSAGCISDSGAWALDSFEDFVFQPDGSGLPCSDRMVFMPRLLRDKKGEAPTGDERKILASYLLDHAHFHVKGVRALPTFETIERQFFSCFAFLQALLDLEESEDHAGNVTLAPRAINDVSD